ncbi:uncharacterized protein EV422DRAFT_544735 [Fimicolochytrium jonesii]|uniref:uncharacterized protein n=1 Tax=Fimicolochytrium jonesii TaxID=1396493 RepID=UPI0022FF0512|nr:uncharacterized protein EV422DRAFT_544735 [Fimicolochytrium jonesii]KAI8816776.1 hypothetical protein EV422DRAFT_544735 [Fimicolochytrium jonesii]
MSSTPPRPPQPNRPPQPPQPPRPPQPPHPPHGLNPPQPPSQAVSLSAQPSKLSEPLQGWHSRRDEFSEGGQGPPSTASGSPKSANRRAPRRRQQAPPNEHSPNRSGVSELRTLTIAPDDRDDAATADSRANDGRQPRVERSLAGRAEGGSGTRVERSGSGSGQHSRRGGQHDRQRDPDGERDRDRDRDRERGDQRGRGRDKGRKNAENGPLLERRPQSGGGGGQLSKPTIMPTGLLLRRPPAQAIAGQPEHHSTPTGTKLADEPAHIHEPQRLYAQQQLPITATRTHKLVDQYFRFQTSEAIHRSLSEIPGSFIVGVIGPRDSGKSTLVSHFLNPTASPSSQLPTAGIDLHITPERVVILDSQSLVGHTPSTQQLGRQDTMESIRVATFMFTVCHVLLIVSPSLNSDGANLTAEEELENIQPLLLQSASRSGLTEFANGGDATTHKRQQSFRHLVDEDTFSFLHRVEALRHRLFPSSSGNKDEARPQLVFVRTNCTGPAYERHALALTEKAFVARFKGARAGVSGHPTIGLRHAFPKMYPPSDANINSIGTSQGNVFLLPRISENSQDSENTAPDVSMSPRKRRSLASRLIGFGIPARYDTLASILLTQVYETPRYVPSTPAPTPTSKLSRAGSHTDTQQQNTHTTTSTMNPEGGVDQPAVQMNMTPHASPPAASVLGRRKGLGPHEQVATSPLPSQTHSNHSGRPGMTSAPSETPTSSKAHLTSAGASSFTPSGVPAWYLMSEREWYKAAAKTWEIVRKADMAAEWVRAGK